MDLEPQKQDNPDIDIENPYLEKPYMVNHPNTNKGTTNKPGRIPSVDGVRTDTESANTEQKNIGPLILGPKEKNKIEQPQPEEKEIDDRCLSSTTPPMVVVDENIETRIEDPNQKVEDLFQTEEKIEGNNNSNKVNIESMKQNELTPNIDISGSANVDTELKIPNRGQLGRTGSSGAGPLGRKIELTEEDRNKFRMSRSFEKYFENDKTPYSEFQKEHPEINDLSEDESTDLYIEWMLDRFILKRWNENMQEKNINPSRKSEPEPEPVIIGPNSKYPRVPDFLENGIMISSGQVYYPFSLKMITGPQSMYERAEYQSVGKELLKSIQKEMVAQRKLYIKNKDAILNNLFISPHKEKLKILNEGEFLNYLDELKLPKDQKKTIWNNAKAIRKFVADLQYYEQAIKNVKLAFTI
jgi:hypothetical protein